MITMEITNKQTNLRKIVYETQRDKEFHLHQLQRQQQFQNAFNSAHGANNNYVEINDDDEDRLVIDLNDDNEAKPAKSLPIIDAGTRRDNPVSAVPIRRSNMGMNLRHDNIQNGNSNSESIYFIYFFRSIGL